MEWEVYPHTDILITKSLSPWLTNETFLEAQSESVTSLSQNLVASRATDEFWNVFLPHWSHVLCGCEREEEVSCQEQKMEESWKAHE